MEDTHRGFLPAAGRDWLLPLYDPFVKLLGGDSARRALLDQAALEHTAHVLDVGCGTGTLVVLIAQRYPKARVVGIDPDPRALARARRKARRGGVSVELDRGYADSLTYPAGSFDREGRLRIVRARAEESDAQRERGKELSFHRCVLVKGATVARRCTRGAG